MLDHLPFLVKEYRFYKLSTNIVLFTFISYRDLTLRLYVSMLVFELEKVNIFLLIKDKRFKKVY